jgi:hypothetical protein
MTIWSLAIGSGALLYDAVESVRASQAPTVTSVLPSSIYIVCILIL